MLSNHLSQPNLTLCSIKRWLAACLAALVHIASSNPVAPNNLFLPSTPSKTANLSAAVKNLGYLPIPAAFQIHPESHPVPIEYEREAVLTNVIQAMEETAMGNIREYMPLWKFRTAEYPQPAITLSTPLETDIKREYVIWGLLLATIAMLSREVYETTQFTLLLRGEEVGSITFGDFSSMSASSGRSILGTEKLGEDLNQNTSMALAATGARTPNSTASLADATPAMNSPKLTDDRASVVFKSSGDDVGIHNLLVYMLVVLSETAIPPSDMEIIDRWTPFKFGVVCRFVLFPTAREQPPFMMFFWLIEAVAKAAWYVIENDAYRNLNMLIYADGKLIGQSVFVYILPNTIDNHKP